jgi:ribonuclease HI
MCEVVNMRVEEFDVYIGRAGKGHDGYFGNPHPIGYCSICKFSHDRAGCIAAFKKDFLERVARDAEYRQRVLKLKGKRLGCFCKPAACHGDVYVEWLSNQNSQSKELSMHITTEELAKGLLVVCDGGSYNNQSPDRIGYGSFRVFRDGILQHSTFDGEVCDTHYFEFGVGITNNHAECSMLLKAMAYASQLIERGYKGTIRIGTDSQTALLGATTKVKKPSERLKSMYETMHFNARALRDQVQFVKLCEQDVKRILGH